MSTVIGEARKHLLQMAPHVAGRRSAVLLKQMVDEVERLRRALRDTRNFLCPIWPERELTGPEQYAEDMMEWDHRTDEVCGDSGSLLSHDEYLVQWHELDDKRDKEEKAAEAKGE